MSPDRVVVGIIRQVHEMNCTLAWQRSRVYKVRAAGSQVLDASNARCKPLLQQAATGNIGGHP